VVAERRDLHVRAPNGTYELNRERATSEKSETSAVWTPDAQVGGATFDGELARRCRDIALSANYALPAKRRHQSLKSRLVPLRVVVQRSVT
jgi:hypothetical protein